MSLHKTHLVNPRETLTALNNGHELDIFQLHEMESFGLDLIIGEKVSAYVNPFLVESGIYSEEERQYRLHNEIEKTRQTLRGYAQLKIYPDMVNFVRSYPLPEDIYTALDEPHTDIIKALAEADDETLTRFCAWNSKYVRDNEARTIAEAEVYKSQFVERVEQAISVQGLPLDQEQLHSRMEQIQISVGDPLVLLALDSGGYYIPERRTAVVSASSTGHQLKQVLWHELLHHLSGQTIILETVEDGALDLRALRLGLAVKRTTDKVWLNEAITEQLTQALLDDDLDEVNFQTCPSDVFFSYYHNQGTYRLERERAQKLMFDVDSAGDAWLDADALVDLKVLLSAYFEDHIPRSDAPQATARKQLWSAIISAYPANYKEKLK